MSLPTTILLVTKQQETADAVARGLHGEELLTLGGVCADLDELRDKLAHIHAAVVLVDIDPQPGPLLRQMETLVARFGETRFVLLADEFGQELLLEAMQAGARHMLKKSAIKADLAATLGRLLPANGSGSSGDGSVITLLAGSGGCGSTTLAFNLANELTLAAPEEESLLIDLDWYYGALAPYLGLQGKFGIGDLLARDGRVDGNLVRSTAVTFSKNLHVLLSPVSVNAPQTEAADYPNLNEVLSACKQAYAHTIIDAPHVSRRVGATLAGASTAVLIVFQLTVKDIHSVRSLRAALVEGGLSENRIALVANRYDKNSSVTPHEAQEALGVKTLHLVANDYQTAVNNINFGRPLSETASASLLRRDIMQLINRLGLAPQVAGEPELARQKKTHPAGLWETLSAATRRSLLFPGATLTGARS